MFFSYVDLSCRCQWRVKCIFASRFSAFVQFILCGNAFLSHLILACQTVLYMFSNWLQSLSALFELTCSLVQKSVHLSLDNLSVASLPANSKHQL